MYTKKKIKIRPLRQGGYHCIMTMTIVTNKENKIVWQIDSKSLYILKQYFLLLTIEKNMLVE